MTANRRIRRTRARTREPLHHLPLKKSARADLKPAARPEESKGLQITTARGTLHIRLNLTVRRKDAWLLLLTACALLLLLASSINEDLRSLLVDALIGLVQVLIFGERKNR